MKSILAMIACAMLGACASATQTEAPDGRATHSLDCSGAARNWGACQQQAEVICGAKGYDVISTSGDLGAITTAGGGEFSASSTTSQGMLIACK